MCIISKDRQSQTATVGRRANGIQPIWNGVSAAHLAVAIPDMDTGTDVDIDTDTDMDKEKDTDTDTDRKTEIER